MGFSTTEASGIPASSSGGEKVRGERVTDRRARRYITITDDAMWEYIDKIMTHPDYDKSFNKVINSALLFGLPTLRPQWRQALPQFILKTAKMKSLKS